MLDLLIKGGRVFDPANQIDAMMNIGVKDGLIVSANDEETAEHTIEANGCIVTPGFIDVHTHLWPLTDMGVQAESSCFPSCVTTAVDAGSCGCGTYENFRPAIQGMRVDAKVLLNVCSAGLTAFRTKVEYLDPSLFKKQAIKRLVERYPNEIVGIKIRMGRETALDMGLDPLKAAKEIGRETGLPLVVHSTNPAVPMKDLIGCLGKGDVLAHAYHGHGNTLLQDGGFDALEEAKKRGVLVDVGDAAWHINFDIMREALRRGLGPDTISTDLTDKGLYKKGRTFSMLHCMSRWLNIGMNLEDVLRCVTVNAAIGLNLGPDAGNLTCGTAADIAIVRVEDSQIEFKDGNGYSHHADKMIRPLATIKDGRIVYCDTSF